MAPEVDTMLHLARVKAISDKLEDEGTSTGHRAVGNDSEAQGLWHDLQHGDEIERTIGGFTEHLVSLRRSRTEGLYWQAAERRTGQNASDTVERLMSGPSIARWDDSLRMTRLDEDLAADTQRVGTNFIIASQIALTAHIVKFLL